MKFSSLTPQLAAALSRDRRVSLLVLAQQQVQVLGLVTDRNKAHELERGFPLLCDYWQRSYTQCYHLTDGAVTFNWKHTTDSDHIINTNREI